MVDIHLLYNHLAECNLWIMSSPPPSTCLTPPLHFIPRGFCGTKLLEISFAPIHLDLHLSKFCAHKWGSSSTSSSTNPCVFPRSCDFLRRAHRTRFEKPGRILKPRRCTEKFHRKLKFFPRLFHTHRWRILNDVLQPEASGQIIKTQTKGIWGGHFPSYCKRIIWGEFATWNIQTISSMGQVYISAHMSGLFSMVSMYVVNYTILPWIIWVRWFLEQFEASNLSKFGRSPELCGWIHVHRFHGTGICTYMKTTKKSTKQQVNIPYIHGSYGISNFFKEIHWPPK